MDKTESLRQLFDGHPYPINKIEMSPREDINLLFLHSLTTAYYVRGDGYVQPQGKLILDVGCGSGYAALAMAIANPGAKIVGIDLSSKSVEIARERMQFHGFKDAEFYAMSIDDLPNLGMQFDYINCDETLYLLPDPTQGLGVMTSVLAPQGIIRANLHSLHNRRELYRGQTLSHFLGLMDGEIGDWECEILTEFMDALKEGVVLNNSWKKIKGDNEDIRMNFFLVGDKGFIIPEMFAMIESNNLELISMVNWRHWVLEDLFQSIESLPEYLELLLSSATPLQRLNIYELLHPVHRLLDFWCGHQDREHLSSSGINLIDSDLETWQTYTFHLHPVLKTEKFKEVLVLAIAHSQPFPLTQFFSCTSAQPLNLFAPATICLWVLWQKPCSMTEIVKYWLTVKPLDPLTLTPVDPSLAFSEVQRALIQLETLVAVLVDNG
jgi:SAM-dependent methyltransferase